MSQTGRHLIRKIIRARTHATLAVVAGNTLMVLTSTVATAQAYPNRPVRIVIPFTPASAMDHIVRTMSDRMSAVLGQPIIALISSPVGRTATSEPNSSGTSPRTDTRY